MSILEGGQGKTGCGETLRSAEARARRGSQAQGEEPPRLQKHTSAGAHRQGDFSISLPTPPESETLRRKALGMDLRVVSSQRLCSLAPSGDVAGNVRYHAGDRLDSHQTTILECSFHSFSFSNVTGSISDGTSLATRHITRFLNRWISWLLAEQRSPTSHHRI